jgi:NDP-sugar pyrophosphorylase family protein
MRAIILAGGFGTRVVQAAGAKPKPLLEVAGKAILEHQIEFLLGCRINEIRLSLHHKAQEIIDFCERRWPGAVQFAVEDEPLGTGGAVTFASRDLDPDEEMLALNCDNLVRDMDLDRFIALGADAVGCVFLKDAREYGLVDVQDARAAGFLEKPKEKTAGLINCGWYLLRPRTLRSVGRESFMLERDLFPRLAEAGDLKVYLHEGYWIDAGTEERLRRADRDFALTP